MGKQDLELVLSFYSDVISCVKTRTVTMLHIGNKVKNESRKGKRSLIRESRKETRQKTQRLTE